MNNEIFSITFSIVGTCLLIGGISCFYIAKSIGGRLSHDWFYKSIGGSFQTVGSNVYAVEQKQMINLAGIIHTNKLKINYLKIKTNKGNIHGNRHQ